MLFLLLSEVTEVDRKDQSNASKKRGPGHRGDQGEVHRLTDANRHLILEGRRLRMSNAIYEHLTCIVDQNTTPVYGGGADTETTVSIFSSITSSALHQRPTHLVGRPEFMSPVSKQIFFVFQ